MLEGHGLDLDWIIILWASCGNWMFGVDKKDI